MHLLDLPPEILQQLLLYCTTPSFFHAIRSCKCIFRLAASSRAVLLHHLERVPGITLGLQSSTISNDDLFRTLRRRGAAHLFGLNLTADCIDFYVGPGTLDPNASWLADGAFAPALKDSLRVRVYDVEGASCRLRRKCAERLARQSGVGKILKVVVRLETTYVLFSHASCPTSAEAFLRKYSESKRQPTERNLNDKDSALVDTEFSSVDLSDISYFLAVDEPSSKGEVLFQMPAPDPWLGRMLVPIDLAVDDAHHCSVLWDLADSISPSVFAQVVGYTARGVPLVDEMNEYIGVRIWPQGERPHEKKSTKVKLSNLKSKLPHSRSYKVPPQPEPLPKVLAYQLKSFHVTKLPRSIGFAQNGRRLKLFGPGDIVPYHVLVISPDSRRYIEDDDGPSNPFGPPNNPWIRRLHNLTWRLTTPFYSHHATQPIRRREDDADESIDVEPRCTTSCLSLATTKISPICWLGTRWEDLPETEVLCVIKATKTKSSNNCSHRPNTDVCTPIEYPNVKIVARLWGWQPSKSSLAGEQNMACCGTRIAIAEWDRIFIWSLDPRALLDEANEPAPVINYYSDQDSGVGSYTSVEQPVAHDTRSDPAWTYPKVYDSTMDTWYVELRPIVLSASKSVNNGQTRQICDTVLIRQMVWKDADTLMVRTDKGLQIWNLGPKATGKRTQAVLEMGVPQDVECMDYEACEGEGFRGNANVWSTLSPTFEITSGVRKPSIRSFPFR